MSARVGAEAALIQGPGGNTSLKSDDCLWVKASGRWLADADKQDIFVPLSLPLVRAQLVAGDADNFDRCILSGGDGALKPSIETAFHAVMRHRFVLHAHAFNCMAVSVLFDGEARLRAAIAPDIRGEWVPYRRPGGPLAIEIMRVLSHGEVDVLLLQNHGVIVGADTAQAAEELLREVERRLSLPRRGSRAVDAARIESYATTEYPSDLSNSDIALDQRMISVAVGAPLIPDQVVFLGGAICVGDTDSGVNAAAFAVEKVTGIRPAFVLLPGVGAYRSATRSRGADSVIDGLIAILRRLPDNGPVLGLSDAETAELLGWDAEHYRQRLDKKLD